ncbi:MAG TPA: glycosyltransferase family 39 protein [Pyrinomonadaceae bacterium]|nr:glycosyltransferase family 39 protein [Pyrinomonadaceae bacterium]
MNALLTLLALLLSAVILFVTPAAGGPALIVCVVLAILAGVLISRAASNGNFMLRLFVGGLLARVLIGVIIYSLNLQEFFGGDAFTYDFTGYSLLKVWQGDNYYQSIVNTVVGDSGAGAWGMMYMVATVYKITGRNMLAIQFVNAVLGAATAPVIFLCAQHLFNNLKVARFAGLFAAFYPSLVLWSSQGLKDGPIVFLLAICMLVTLKLGEKVSFKYLTVLACSLFALLSLRFYIFYMVVAAITGAFVIGMRPRTAQSLIRQFGVILFVGLALTYLGVTRYANTQFETFGSLERVQVSRSNLAQSANSGFASDVDVTTAGGALSTIPIGVTYLLFAPFPWQLANLRQSITLPEMVIWWMSFPFLVLGLWFTLKYRLRQSLPILIFTFMLTLAYSVFQGNVGTAYRQRSQLLVFYFIFVSVGYVLTQERREDRRQQALAAKKSAMTGGRRISCE